MTNTSQPGQKLDLLVPAVVVSTLIAVFAVVTQLLNATNVASLSTTQMLTAWLVAVGLIVLLWIAYMISSAYVTAKRPKEALADVERAAVDVERAKGRAEQAAKDAEQQKTRAAQAEAEVEQQKTRAMQAEADAEQARDEAKKAEKRVEEALKGLDGALKGYDIPRIDGSAEEDRDAWVPPAELRHLIGKERSVSTEEVFPEGCYLEPDSIRLVADKRTGQQVYECMVVDRNPALKDRPHETLVRVLANQTPPPSSIPRFDLVEFENLTVTSYVTDRSPMRIKYSLRATHIYPAAATTGRVTAPWTAPEP